MDAPIGRPKVLEETCDSKSGLPEDFFRDALFVRTEPEGTEVFEPDSDWVAHAVGEMPCRRQINLDPGPLLMNPGSNRFAENFRREAYNLFGEGRVFGRVLNRVCWQSAAIADQVPKQSKLGVAHRVLVRALKNSRYRYVVIDLQLVQPAPPLHGQELVIGSGAN